MDENIARIIARRAFRRGVCYGVVALLFLGAVTFLVAEFLTSEDTATKLPLAATEIATHEPPQPERAVVGRGEFDGLVRVGVPRGYAVEFKTAVPISLTVRRREEGDRRFVQLPGDSLYRVEGGSSRFGMAVTSLKVPGRNHAVRVSFEGLFTAKSEEVRVVRVSSIELDTSKNNTVVLWAAREAAVWVTYHPRLPPRTAEGK